MHKLRNLFWYAGISKEEYELIADDIRHYNRKSLGIYSAMSGLITLILVIISFNKDSIISQSFLVYSILTALFFFVHLINIFVADSQAILLRISGYFFIAALYAFGIIQASINAQDIAVTYIVLLMVLPLLLILRPIHIDALIILSEVIFLFFMYRLNTPRVFRINLLNSVIYGVVSMVISNSMLAMKIHKYQADNQNKKLMRTDILTGLSNRHAYTETFLSYSDKPLDSDLVYIAMDMNGLKKVNDSFGHLAGDELITAAAVCIQKAFGQYGDLFRTGGDEFIAVLHATDPQVSEAVTILETEIVTYNKDHNDALSLSLGYATSADLEHGSFKDLSHLADIKMYQNKSEYYQRSGKDRRR